MKRVGLLQQLVRGFGPDVTQRPNVAQSCAKMVEVREFTAIVHGLPLHKAPPNKSIDQQRLRPLHYHFSIPPHAAFRYS